MSRLIFVLIVSCCCFTAGAQTRRDTTWVTSDKGNWNITYRVRPKETVFMLARRYHVPPAIFAEANKLTYDSKLKEGSSITIPIGAYNQKTSRPVNNAEARSLYYRVQAADDLYQISRSAGVPQRTLQQWNSLADNDVNNGQVILVGWVLYDPTSVPVKDTTHKPNTAGLPATAIATVKKDTVHKYILPATATTPQQHIDTVVPVTTAKDTAKPAVSPLEELYLQQTAAESNVVTEKGTAAFFTSAAGNTGGVIYAFSNTAPKGAVVRVFNPGNGKTAYVKILGQLPGTKQYYNAIIGISSLAKKVLGVTDTRLWCELSYAGN